MEEKFYLQVGNSKLYLDCSYDFPIFKTVLTNVKSYSTFEMAQAALDKCIKYQTEIVDKCESFYNFVYNATPEQKDELYSFLYKRAIYIHETALNYAGRFNRYNDVGVIYNYISNALSQTLSKTPEFYSEEPFCIIKKCASILELDREHKTNWDESTKWFNLNKCSEIYNRNWAFHYENNKKILDKLKKCKPTKPEPEHKIHFYKITKPSWVLCDSKIHCSSCGANIAEMKYLSLPVGKSSRSTYICPICLVKIGNQVQELVDTIGQEMIDAHSKMLFIKSL
jgi:hypothetical protein